MEHSNVYLSPIESRYTPCRSERRAGRAVVLGATIAFGSCTLAACADGADHAEKVPLLAATASLPSEQEEIEDEPTLALDADEGSVATLQASPGFTPDPLTHDGTTAPTSLAANEVDERCEGWLAPEPDFVLTADRPFSELALMAASRDDVTLFIMGPDGEARCADDDEGTNPIVRGLFGPGTYRVWVGTAEREAEVPYVLALSELDDTVPSRLLH